jgi:uncharacterized protein YutE (UPF0331/DUF86 family)
MDNVLVNKAATIERCLKRVQEEYQGKGATFDSNFTQQDAVILNLQRLCEAAIDMATRVVRVKHLGVPQTRRDVFQLLEQAGVIPEDLSRSMQAMVGFRNIAVHDYTTMNLAIIRNILDTRLGDFTRLSELLLSQGN